MIPKPKQMRIFKKDFWLTSIVHYQRNAELPEALFRWLVEDLDSYYHNHFDEGLLDDDHSMIVLFRLAPFAKKVPPDYYFLKVDTLRIQIQAETPNGLRYAVQTLKQHLHNSFFDHLNKFDEPGDLPCLEIRDWPSFHWRGLHLDVSRHFFNYKFIRRYLDWMAGLKLNKFHWHLSDDQGWRIESKRFPRLHEVGAWRTEADGSRYGGFYTRRQIKLVLDYAAERGIEVIPEIDIPGHAMAILAAYPELACNPQNFATLNVWGISQDILCAGKDGTIAFLKELFTENAELFPAPYIHLGGDEAPKERWQACPHCQNRLAEQHLANEEELQGWLVRVLSRHLQGLGKTVIGWDEILDGGIDSRPIIMCWRGDAVDAARKAHANGNRYIICPNTKLYFDWKPADHPDEPGAHGVTRLRDVYDLELAHYRFAHPELFLGGQANLWTEYVPNARIAKELVQFRILALAELFWSDPPEKNYMEFWDRFWNLRDYI